MRILAGGPIVHDIDMYNKVHELFSIFSATYSRENDYGDDLFSNSWATRFIYSDTRNQTDLRSIYKPKSGPG